MADDDYGKNFQRKEMRCNLFKRYHSLLWVMITVLVFVANNTFTDFMRVYYRWSYQSINSKNGIELEKSLRDAVYEIIDQESWADKPMGNKTTLCSYLIRPKVSVYGFGEYGYLFHYAYLYAKKKHDTRLIELIKKKFEKFELSERNDQVAYGNVAIDLFLETNDLKYKKIASQIFARLDSVATESGIVLYRDGSREQHVDGIGLICPFLFYYADVFNETRAGQLAIQTIGDYARWGCDPITGIPCQTYDLERHIKKNHANWGRGISWYLIGLEKYRQSDSVVISRISSLENTLLDVKSNLYTQYFAEKGDPDLSATIPILYYLYNKKKRHFTKSEINRLLSPYIDRKGIIRYCSPSISYPHVGVNVWTTNIFCQGLLLYFLSELQ